MAIKLPPVATRLKEVLDNLQPAELLSSAELSAHAGLTPLRALGGYGGTLARLATIYLPEYTAKVGSKRYWGRPDSIQELKTQLGEGSAN